MFLKFDPEIKGESVAAGHKNEIQVLAWSWGAQNSGTRHIAKGGGGGKSSFNDLSITKYVDSASPLLLQACATGKHIDKATLVCRKAGATKQEEYVKLNLEECLISSYSTGGSGGEVLLTENVTINFAKFTFNYMPQTEKGSLSGNVSVSYSIAETA